MATINSLVIHILQNIWILWQMLIEFSFLIKILWNISQCCSVHTIKDKGVQKSFICIYFIYNYPFNNFVNPMWNSRTIHVIPHSPVFSHTSDFVFGWCVSIRDVKSEIKYNSKSKAGCTSVHKDIMFISYSNKSVSNQTYHNPRKL